MSPHFLNNLFYCCHWVFFILTFTFLFFYQQWARCEKLLLNRLIQRKRIGIVGFLLISQVKWCPHHHYLLRNDWATVPQRVRCGCCSRCLNNEEELSWGATPSFESLVALRDWKEERGVVQRFLHAHQVYSRFAWPWSREASKASLSINTVSM
jgi:hypothetical protein